MSTEKPTDFKLNPECKNNRRLDGGRNALSGVYRDRSKVLRFSRPFHYNHFGISPCRVFLFYSEIPNFYDRAKGLSPLGVATTRRPVNLVVGFIFPIHLATTTTFSHLILHNSNHRNRTETSTFHGGMRPYYTKLEIVHIR